MTQQDAKNKDTSVFLAGFKARIPVLDILKAAGAPVFPVNLIQSQA
jgi:hypothetical protein